MMFILAVWEWLFVISSKHHTGVTTNETFSQVKIWNNDIHDIQQDR